MKNIYTETVITFIRHGHVYNPKEILYGRIPGFSLSDQGRFEVVKTAAQLRQQGISHIYTSPMKRARETASIIGNILKFVPQVSYFLNEVRLFCQGISIEKYHATIQKNLYEQENITKGQESVEDIALRMRRFVEMVLQRHRGTQVAAISHGDPIVILKANTTGAQFSWDYKIAHYIRPGKFLTLQVKDYTYEWS